jgi:hypothetical protein
MKKTTGRVVSLVLALALVVTSFSGTFAFAASKTVSGTPEISSDKIYLVNGGTGNTKKVEDAINVTNLVSKDRSQTLTDAEVTSISHASGDTLVRWKIDDGKVTLTLKDTGKSGKEVLKVLIKGTYTDDDDNKVTVSGSKEFTVNVLDKDQYVIGKKDSGYKVAGDGIDAPDSFAQTAGSSQEIRIYKPAVNTTDAKATYTPVDGDSLYLGDASKAAAADLKGKTVVEISNDNNLTAELTGDTIKVLVGKGYDNQKYTDNATTGNVTITALDYNKDTGKKIDDTKTVFKTKIEKKVDVSVLTSKSGATYTISKADKGGNTVLAGVKNENLKDSNKDVVVTGAEVNFPSTTTSVNVDSKANVKKISGTVGALNIGEASVGEVDVTGSVEVSDKANVGNIKATATVEVGDGKTGNIETKGDVKVNGGTVGNIETTETAGTVTIKADDDASNITVKDIKSKGTVTITSEDDSKVTTGTITLAANADVTLIGSNTTVKTVDFDYFTGKLTFGNESDKFVGTIGAPLNAINATIVTEDDDTNVTITGDVTVDTISVDENSVVNFDGKVRVETLDGEGTLRLGSNKLFINNSASGPKVQLTDAVLANGMTAYTAKADALSEDDLNNYGFKVKKSAGNSIDTFKVDSLTFAGVKTNKDNAKIAKDYTETFTASAYPASTVLPAGAKIDWSFDGNEDVFQVTKNGNSASVKVLKIDADFASENTATLTAKVVDADGDELEDYSPAKIALTAIAVPDAKSDTNKDFSVATGASYTFKITSATAPSFTLGSAGVFTVAPVVHAAGSNDYLYKITATGKVGSATGVYLNGNKLLVATVSAPAFKSDTTGNVTVKGSYTVKITATTAPTFGVGTAGVVTPTFVSKSGNDYFYKVTAVGKTGTQTGIYVNGVKTFVAVVG